MITRGTTSGGARPCGGQGGAAGRGAEVRRFEEGGLQHSARVGGRLEVPLGRTRRRKQRTHAGMCACPAPRGNPPEASFPKARATCTHLAARRWVLALAAAALALAAPLAAAGITARGGRPRRRWRAQLINPRRVEFVGPHQRQVALGVEAQL